jgi:hypothetical protein
MIRENMKHEESRNSHVFLFHVFTFHAPRSFNVRIALHRSGSVCDLVVEIKRLSLRPLAVLSSESCGELLGVRDPPEE